MQRINRINFWLGVIVSIGLLIESATGIYMYVQAGQQQRSLAQNMPNGFSGVNNTSGGSSQSQFGGNGNFQGGGQRFRQFGSMRRTRNFQTTIYGLIANIVALILAVAGLIAAAIAGRTNAERKKELATQE
ncbi:hypothetical protein [Sporolactobacillus pectinivorans]|uniref:hypothetical protein n=1 Tax=Sporolactobacillus pectinivorans TaxID=1591408 RepID=UPI000C268746|nr:hypothetical protein [Sporolactobacillus pectinivorans]